MKKQIKKQESGRSMIEMVGVLAVMGLITAAAFVLINSAMSSQRLSRVDDDVSGIVNGVRLLYNASADFTGVDGKTATNTTGDEGKATLILLGFGGEESDGKRYQNPYGGYYKLANSSSDRAFTVQVTNLGKKTCTVLAARQYPAGGTVSASSCAGDASANSVTIKYGKSDSSMNP